MTWLSGFFSIPFIPSIAYSAIPQASLSRKLKDPYTKPQPLRFLLTKTPSILVAVTCSESPKFLSTSVCCFQPKCPENSHCSSSSSSSRSNSNSQTEICSWQGNCKQEFLEVHLQAWRHFLCQWKGIRHRSGTPDFVEAEEKRCLTKSTAQPPHWTQISSEKVSSEAPGNKQTHTHTHIKLSKS